MALSRDHQCVQLLRGQGGHGDDDDPNNNDLNSDGDDDPNGYDLNSDDDPNGDGDDDINGDDDDEWQSWLELRKCLLSLETQTRSTFIQVLINKSQSYETVVIVIIIGNSSKV